MPRPSARGPLSGTTVLVAGAGLAGLVAARDLERAGATVSIVEARDRLGGRVWTIRGLAAGQHAEGGADLIESAQTSVLELARELRLRTSRILRGGFGYYGTDARGRVGVQRHLDLFEALGRLLRPHIEAYELTEQRWHSPIVQRLSRTPVSTWLDQVRADARMRQRLRALRGLFLADPEDLSLLALVDFFATNAQGSERMVRLTGGNDAIATELARRLRTPPDLNAALRRVRQDAAGVVTTVETAHGVVERRADYLVSTLPASVLRDVRFEPGLPEPQRDALEHLKYGAATRLLLQFARRFWRHVGRPLAFGSDRATGAVWDGNEQQRGPEGVLSLLAGGGASAALQDLLRRRGPDGVAAELAWLGRPSRVLASLAIAWETDPWSRGGYAYFDAGFDPAWRDWLSRPFGRVVFGGEHTSIRWQGYMNGAIESGRRTAREIEGLKTL
ncbi:MAG: FAD-dependent oxidoreductase [Acidobacteria bacterium]|nr:FAD-dependent oxidoreductase [Acidobacteriota bacterium]